MQKIAGGVDMRLHEIVEMIRAELDEKEKRREELFRMAREVRRMSTRAIWLVHLNEYTKGEELIERAGKMLSKLSEHDLRFSFLHEAGQEYAEAVLTLHLLTGRELPSHTELRIPAEWYLAGLGDTVGELRRRVLVLLREGRLEEAEGLLELMMEINRELSSLMYPGAVAAIKRKQDIARVLVERTMSEVTVAAREAALRSSIEECMDALRKCRNEHKSI